VAFDPVEALPKLVDLGLQVSSFFELASRARGCERLVYDDREWNDPLRAVSTGHHPRRYASASVPRPEGRTRNAGRINRLFEGYPAVFDRIAGEVAQKAVPTIFGAFVFEAAHMLAPSSNTVAHPAI
jgi:hypothetical protein